MTKPRRRVQLREGFLEVKLSDQNQSKERISQVLTDADQLFEQESLILAQDERWRRA